MMGHIFSVELKSGETGLVSFKTFLIGFAECLARMYTLASSFLVVTSTSQKKVLSKNLK